MKHARIIGITLILALVCVPIVSAKSPPQKIYECENGGDKVCGTWILQDANHYYATWDNGATATLTITMWGPDRVALSRLDTGGGFSAKYTGYLDSPNNKINDGIVTFSSGGSVWKGTWDADFS